MKNYLSLIYLAALALLLGSCFRDFEPNIESTPVLCMNSVISPGDSIYLTLTHTWRYDDPDPGDVLVRDAKVDLFVNGALKERMEGVLLAPVYNPGDYHYGDDRYVYRADYIPAVGDVIRIEAHSEVYGEAWAEVTVPKAVPIDKVETEVRDLHAYEEFDGISYHMDLDFKVWFTDPGDSDNFFKFDTNVGGYYRTDNPDGSVNIEYVQNASVDCSAEPLFSEHLSALESTISDTGGYTVFSDRQIKGKSYPLHIKVSDIIYKYSNPGNDPNLRDAKVRFTLNHIDRSYYDHVISVWVVGDGLIGSLGNIGLGDTPFPASNVSTKAGVVAAAAPFSVNIPIMDIVESQK